MYISFAMGLIANTKQRKCLVEYRLLAMYSSCTAHLVQLTLGLIVTLLHPIWHVIPEM